MATTKANHDVIRTRHAGWNTPFKGITSWIWWARCSSITKHPPSLFLWSCWIFASFRTKREVRSALWNGFWWPLQGHFLNRLLTGNSTLRSPKRSSSIGKIWANKLFTSLKKIFVMLLRWTTYSGPHTVAHIRWPTYGGPHIEAHIRWPTYGGP